jgi:glycosyltransferase involved in cell wall biosynthesis
LNLNKNIPDIGVFMQRVGPMHAQQLASLAERTKHSFNLIYVYAPGTAHENINKVLDRVTSRYVIIMDDDLTFLTDNWLEKMLAVMQEHDDIGMLIPHEVKDEDHRGKVLEGHLDRSPHTDHRITLHSWNPGYVMLFDMERLDGLRADEEIPGPSGMSDLDLSLQVRSQGFHCARFWDVVVYHPWKPMDREWRDRWDIVQEENLHALSQEQCQYMERKWGDFFTSNKSLGILGSR